MKIANRIAIRYANAPNITIQNTKEAEIRFDILVPLGDLSDLIKKHNLVEDFDPEYPEGTIKKIISEKKIIEVLEKRFSKEFGFDVGIGFSEVSSNRNIKTLEDFKSFDLYLRGSILVDLFKGTHTENLIEKVFGEEIKKLMN